MYGRDPAPVFELIAHFTLVLVFQNMIYMFEYMYIYNMIVGLFTSSLEVDVDIIFFVEPFIPKGSAKQSFG